ncbi:hypothetical protein BJ980_001555 [Nocardioides daedukensis]|uniref:AbiEi antitoxin N-terminal domain-containing protein n=1 Tax=Nocardioides daedukensis TaxID=634462 RepID=A0A7Y9UPV0_9ACTN|nr:type IV toxin-antitoxin system AbiEi family antitoxin domain-containing protein [Nocardioides daedukensis]NYG58632.1 hypothetical protein [Nocardioides daedukensis]
MERLTALLAQQAGVISRRQAIELGLDDLELSALVRADRLHTVHPGVHVDHPGPLTWHQRAWAAVLHAWPAALSHGSALRAANGPGRRLALGHQGDPGPIHVAVGTRRKVAVQPGIVVHRLGGLSSRVEWNRSPPRLRIEEAGVELAAASSSDYDAVSVLADLVSSRQTTPGRLLDALAGRPTLARRDFLTEVLDDVTQQTCTVLAQGYLLRVVRPHGLPMAVPQPIDPRRGLLRAEVLHGEFGQVVGLDGRIFASGSRRGACEREHDWQHGREHDWPEDWPDDSGAELAAPEPSSIRLGWRQVFERPCATAVQMVALLRARGWHGTPHLCPECSVEATRLLLPGA